MANYITVSTISAKPYAPDANVSLQETVDQMKNHIKEELCKVLPDQPDLIALPEMCDVPLRYPAEKRMDFYRFRKNQILDMVRELCTKNHCYIVFPSQMEWEDGIWRNSAMIIDRQGNIIGVHHENHPTIDVMEIDGVVRGTEAPIIECDFGRIACPVCFDLYLDDLRAIYAKEKPDIILFPSLFHGRHMQNYWASSCRAYFVSSVGALTSSIISPVGELIAYTTNYIDYVTQVINLDYVVVHLDYNGSKLRDMKKKYGRKVQIQDPGLLGSVLISSETDEFTIQDIIKEFNIELLDDYLARELTY